MIDPNDERLQMMREFLEQDVTGPEYIAAQPVEKQEKARQAVGTLGEIIAHMLVPSPSPERRAQSVRLVQEAQRKRRERDGQ